MEGAVHLRAAVNQVDDRSGRHQRAEIFTISLSRMRIGATMALLAVAVLAALSAAACGSGIFREYEYEEEMYLAVDGSATVYVNASVPALNALRGSTFNPDPAADIDREAVRAFFTTPVTRVTRRPSLSRRNNRRFVHVRLDVDHVGLLPKAGPFSWSAYTFGP